MDRRRIDLVEPGMPTAPIHRDGVRTGAGLGHWLFDARTVELQAAAVLGERTEAVLGGPRTILGPLRPSAPVRYPGRSA